MKTIFTDDQIQDRLVGKYDELFENCVIKERPRERADYEWPDTNEERSLPMKKKCEVKIDTPYDGRENDWLAFARQQAEFYQYAKQYIVNLQIRTEEIDQEIEEIEDILQVTEGEQNGAECETILTEEPMVG